MSLPNPVQIVSRPRGQNRHRRHHHKYRSQAKLEPATADGSGGGHSLNCTRRRLASGQHPCLPAPAWPPRLTAGRDVRRALSLPEREPAAAGGDYANSCGGIALPLGLRRGIVRALTGALLCCSVRAFHFAQFVEQSRRRQPVNGGTGSLGDGPSAFAAFGFPAFGLSIAVSRA